MNHPLTGLVDPQHIVVIGPLGQESSPAGQVWQRLQAANVDVMGVDYTPAPDNRGVFSTITQLPKVPDIAVITEEDIRQAVIDCEYAGIPLALVSATTTLPERSADSRSRTRLLPLIDQAWLRPKLQVDLIPDHSSRVGNVAILSQSALVGSAMLQAASAAEVSCSFYIAVKGGGDVSPHEMLQVLLPDQDTQVIGIYLEEWSHSRLLLDTVALVVTQKPVVILMPQREIGRTDPALHRELVSRTGAVVVDTLRDYNGAVSALAAPDTPTPQRFVSFRSDTTAPRSHWRHTHALRHLCGVDDKCWLVDAPQSDDARRAFATWRQQAAYPVLTIATEIASHEESGTIKAQGVAASLLQAMRSQRQNEQTASRLTADQVSGLRHTLSQSHQSPVHLPQCSTLLEEAGINLVAHQWVGSPAEAELAARNVGWPVKMWTVGDDTASVSRPINSPDTLRQAYRRLSPSGRVWLQTVPQQGIELQAMAIRHPEYGPIIECQLGGVYHHTHRPVRVLLPLSEHQADALLQELHMAEKCHCLTAHQQNYQAARRLIVGLSDLFSALPELQQLSLPSIQIDSGQAAVVDGSLVWQ